MLFATPDLGAGGIIVLFFLGVWLACLLFSLVGIIIGIRFFSRASLQRKWRGLLILLVSASMPVALWYGPSVLFVWNCGRPPLRGYPNAVEKGMTMEQVRALIGEPHGINPDQSWVYYLDNLYVFYCRIAFGPDGRVEFKHGN
jgi:hypothetical protein